MKMTCEQASEYINSFTKSGKPVADLSRFSALAQALGNPQNSLKFVHIAGTNGKGSVCEYIALALQKEGYLTGKFTSPFIIKQAERIQLNGVNISDDDFAGCCSAVKEKADESGRNDYSQFEIFFGAALVYYMKKRADIVVLETGIGGTLDCTNIIVPALSVITSVDFDHCAILGNTLAEIASHKAGIIKKDIPAVLSPVQDEAVFSVVRAKAAQMNSALVIPDINDAEIIHTSLLGTEFVYKNERFRTKMGGAHQMHNALTATEALRLLNISEDSIKFALENAALPARLFVVRKSPLFVVDGSHNPSGIEAARELISLTKKERGLNQVCVLMGMMKDKDYKTALKISSQIAEKYVFTDGFSPNAVPIEEMTASLSAINADIPVKGAKSVKDALMLARSEEHDALIVMGSLYLAGSVLEIAENEIE